jgi:hypothetical protein
MMVKYKKPELLKANDIVKLLSILTDVSFLENIDDDEFFERAHKKYTFSKKLLEVFIYI